FSRKTISSPRRKISTSELLTLNFLGSLTAWLFPDLNTRAVAICHLLLHIYITVYTCASLFSSFSKAMRASRRCAFGEFADGQSTASHLARCTQEAHAFGITIIVVISRRRSPLLAPSGTLGDSY